MINDIGKFMDVMQNFPNAKLEMSYGDLLHFGQKLIIDCRKSFEKEMMDRKLESEDYLVDPDTVMARMGISRSTLYRWCKKEVISPVNVGGERKFRVSDINRLMQG